MTSSGLPAPFRLLALDRVGSTNDEARRLALDGAAADFLLVTAREQTKGRGRRGRTWISPAGNLHCSVLLAVGRLAEAAQLGFVAAVALVDALSGLVPEADFRCKWPNDVLIDGCKVAGMLLESAAEGWLVLGLGVDVAAAPPPDQVAYRAAALAEKGFSGGVETVLAAFCQAFAPWVGRWRADGFASVRQAWLERCRGLGQPIAVRLENETVTGVFAGLDADGALLLEQGGAGVRRLLAGDVFFPER